MKNMKTQYRHVDFNEKFIYPAEGGLVYTKANHNRGRIARENGRFEFKSFRKNAVVEIERNVTHLTQYMEVK